MSLIVLPGHSGDRPAPGWLRCTGLADVEFPETQVRPFCVSAISPDGEENQWLMKPRSRLTATGSCLELIAARFARLLGVPVPDFGIIEVRGESLSRMPPVMQAKLAPEVGPNFGSRFLRGFIDPLRPQDVPASCRDAAARIYALDVASDNADRMDQGIGGRVRSNLLVGNGELYAIDHQNTFAWYFLIGQAGPQWNPEMERRARREHFLRTVIAIAPGVTLQDARNRLRHASATDVAALTEAIPAAWMPEAGGCVAKVGEFLQDVRRRADEIFDAIEGGAGHA